jgi:hypothetical protein
VSQQVEPAQDRLLWRLEQEELRALSWGRVDGVLSDAELEALAAEEIGDPAERRRVLDELIDWHLVLDVGQQEAQWRTRFGESVRLLARNRQLTPTRPWRAAPTLVNDFRVVARPRTYPRRDMSLQQFVDGLGTQHPLTDEERRALESMLTVDNRPMTLAQFQFKAAQRIRDELLSGGVAATVVSAGTGSGKTKAFYLPALAYTVHGRDHGRWARVLALYPRNELLKDQLSEALAQVELIAAGGGPLTAVGALFGPTVPRLRDVPDHARDPQRAGWTLTDGGYACSYLRCPRGCGRDLFWTDADLRAEREILQCPQCGWRSREGQIALTRTSIGAASPHLLFTTTEMLNRGMADAAMRGVFVGQTAATRPRALLLDEVHTYGGVHGAQVALLLRRWRNALGPRAPLHIVGLSATLEAPAAFMSTLTGLRDVLEVSPQHNDMTEQAAEYGMVMRGNPVSGTALLSTTIQTAFLLERLLESRNLRKPSGTSGSRLFAFTDNLDVTNRLFWDLRDAERGWRGRPPLASLRAESSQPDHAARDSEGQIWRLPPQLGWPLGSGDRLRVTRTSSQDVGVDFAADVIVATASLEVGFDDPEVGAVLQHKAPRDDAAFIQRKGRAGRQFTMRPWTIVVLSDYGKDRLRYQAYESLFAPVLRASSLPLDNLHVLKMQAAYSLLDWLTLEVPGLNARSDLSRRAGAGSPSAHRQAAVAQRLRAVLDDPRVERSLERHIRQSLQLSPDQATETMWQPPRAVMTDVVPTLLRRLERNWYTATGQEDLLIRDAPLPEHAPQAMFSDLNLPEVEIIAPRRDERPPRLDRLSAPQALGEFVPGRVSRRYGVERLDEWHWIPLPEADDDGRRRSEISTWVQLHQPAGEVHLPGEPAPRPVFRPWKIELSLAASDKRSANARARWHTTLTPSGQPLQVPVPQTASLHGILSGLEFHTHALRAEVSAIRAIPQVAADVEDGVEAEVDIVHEGRPAAVGFTADVDAVRLLVRSNAIPRIEQLTPAARRAAWTAWFERAVFDDPYLRGRASRFSAGWLVVLYHASLASVAIGEQLEDLGAAVRRVRELGLQRCLLRALEAVFAVDSEDEDESRGAARLRALIEDESAMAAVDAVAKRLVTADPGELSNYLQRATLATVAAAVREGFQRMAPTFDAESLVIDLPEFGASETAGEHFGVWLCEPDVGSGGTIEELRALNSEDPARLARLVAAAVGPSELELTGWAVRRILQATERDSALAAAFVAIREARSLGGAAQAQAELRAALRTLGLPSDHGVMSTLNLRVLRPGSSPDTDRLTLQALELWELNEDRLGIEIDARVVAYALSRDEASTLEDIYSLLWPRGRDARRASLDAYSRFAADLPTERLLLEPSLHDRSEAVPLGDGACERIQQILAQSGSARLVAEGDKTRELRDVIDSLLIQPIDVGSVWGYPRIVGAARTADNIELTLELPEAAA